ncbi:bifunctional folylpolyglutamate synthase/dihydrofolate synthase [Oceanomicrobium pacificus]|uniref:Dihydrofolate synthase/folylpolyglutamate synthase n=1 Tax=Oceanomicrobium pacificus TaxID=2692916 RepID=A0A6B0TSU9_9RHOB|nr:folylpolyglutamate synthase/dihydrofolate synthase family protein [Oceanomicrobium pacificus]MXU64748.1 bifunctional folylpolyglutamate synthase/dihydrofolate synthase [Oceanomicrobium pacificus]
MSSTTSDAILERMMALHPKIIDLTLDRMHRLLAALGHPERNLPPVIHIAGTNGKGSTQAMIRAGLEAAGLRVHAYTSPHLARFHERIRLAGTLISEPDLQAVLDECLAANGDAPITYFEITTCAALLAFSRVDADATLLEVGLGGRLDATNVVDAPRLTLITPVSLDHQQYLGDTLTEIAGEKAGILKAGVPTLIGPQAAEAEDAILRRAAAVGAPVTLAGQDFQTWEERGRMVYQDMDGLLDLPLPVLPGAHQVGNAGLAIAALRALGLTDEHVAEAAIRKAEWPARMQRLRKGPLVDAATAGGADLWLDGGHNPAAGIALAETLSRLEPRPLHLICGMLNTKDVTGYLAPLAPLTDRLHAVSIPGEAATLSARETADAARAVGMEAVCAPSVADAVGQIADTAPGARILICGSLYLAGRILRENG